MLDDSHGAVANHQRRGRLGGAGDARAHPADGRRCSGSDRRHEPGAASALVAAGLPVAIVNPRQVRDFAKALGLLEKTHALDAGVSPPLPARIQPTPRPLPDDLQADLHALVTRRRQLVEMLTAERNRVPLARGAVRKNLLAHIAWLDKQLGKTDRDLRTRIEASPIWRVRDRCCNQSRFGPTTSACLLACLPELGTLTHRQISKLVGLAPLPDDSGTRRGYRRIQGGRGAVRTAFTWPPSPPLPTIRPFGRPIAAGVRQANCRKSRWWPRCTNC